MFSANSVGPDQTLFTVASDRIYSVCLCPTFRTLCSNGFVMHYMLFRPQKE